MVRSLYQGTRLKEATQETTKPSVQKLTFYRLLWDGQKQKIIDLWLIHMYVKRNRKKVKFMSWSAYRFIIRDKYQNRKET